MSDSKAGWHPYPKEKPTRWGEYLITIKTQGGNIVDVGLFFGNTFQDQNVIAWADMPEPYEKGAEE